MRFSLVLATVGRVLELEAFLRSLEAQEHPDVDLVVVDQNRDDRLVSLLRGRSFQVRHIRSELGLSRARNVALPLVNGDVVAFPDDDCTYPPGLLWRVQRFLEMHEYYEGLTGRVINMADLTPLWRFDETSGEMDKENVWSRGASCSMFLRRRLVDNVGNFDESLGLGSGTNWGSGEETDYLIRCLDKGGRIYYDTNTVVYHPPVSTTFDLRTARRGYAYGCGMGRVLADYEYPLRFVAKCFVRAFGGGVIAALMGRPMKALYHMSVLRGRFSGWLDGRRLQKEGKGADAALHD